MENRNTLIGTLLIGVLLMAFFVYTGKKQKEQKPEKATNTQVQSNPQLKGANANEQSISAANTSPTESLTDSAAMAQKQGAFGLFANAASGESKKIVLENEVQKITLNTKGGFIESIELKKYKTWDGKPLILFNGKNTHFSYQFVTGNNQIVSTSDLYFEPTSAPFSIKGDEKKTFSLRANAGEGYIEQSFALSGNNYLIGYNLELKNLKEAIAANNTFISGTWNSTLPSLEKDLPTERRYSALYFRYKDSNVSHLKDDGNEEQNISTPLEWISFKQQFFNTTIISPKSEFKSAVLKTAHANDEKGYVKKYNANFTIPFKSADDVQYAFSIYAGPNRFQTLAAIGFEFQDILKLGPDFFLFAWIKYITRFIIWVFGIFDSTHLNYGIIILIMTIFLKIILHPLTFKSYKSAASMKLLQPELTELREKYGEDQARLGQEQMKLYQRAGVSPFGGCLPLLLQMPILMAMYYFFPASIELRQQPFLWATDLSSYDAIVTFSSALPLIGQHISLFTVLMTISSIVQAVMNKNVNQMGQQQPGMQYLPYIMPLMLMFLFNSFPAALTYYYLLQNVIGMGQQWVIQKFFIDENKLRKQIEENKKNPKPKSTFQQKLEEMQRQAAQNQKKK
jgi:YidC/Oxa1 family membrane protein insertase